MYVPNRGLCQLQICALCWNQLWMAVLASKGAPQVFDPP